MEAVEMIRGLLSGLGVDPDSPELKDTPERYWRALKELTCGYGLRPATILAKTFPVEGTEVVAFQGIHFAALCAHHLLPFTGTVALKYLPNGKVVGLSKVARLVDCLARRLTLQERLTSEIAEALYVHLQPHGVLVQVRAQHQCVCCRGVRQGRMDVLTVAKRGQLP